MKISKLFTTTLLVITISHFFACSKDNEQPASEMIKRITKYDGSESGEFISNYSYDNLNRLVSSTISHPNRTDIHKYEVTV